MARDFPGPTAPGYWTLGTTALAQAPPFTMAMLFMMDDVAQAAGTMVSKFPASFIIDHVPSGQYRGNTAPANALPSGTTYPAGVVHHGAIVFNGASSLVYVNGAQAAAGNLPNWPAGGGARFLIGSRDDGPTTYPFNGRLAELALWGEALNDRELKALARHVSPRIIRPLALRAHFPLWGLGTTEADTSAARLIATLAAGTSAPARHLGGSPMVL